MLKCNINREKKKVMVKGKGTAQDLVLEVAFLVGNIYRHILAQNPEAAQGFKNVLIGTLLDPDSPVWSEPMTKEE